MTVKFMLKIEECEKIRESKLKDKDKPKNTQTHPQAL
jgi:hypothetical protein